MSHSNKSLEDVHESVNVQASKKGWRKMLAFLGPAYLVAVGYMDPGNWATDIEGGSKYGYSLLWVLVMSNLMAILLQSLSARLGIVTRRDLAQINRETYPPLINFCLYLLAEIAIAAMDLAEIIGMAIGLQLLTGLPLIWGVTITVFDTFLLLYLQRFGIRKMEAFIISLIAIILGSFVIELFFVKPQVSELIVGLKPSLPDEYALYIAIGILGATVMPHNLYLHSALVQTRKIGEDKESKRKAIWWNNVDSAIALNLALFVNAAILILAGAVFYQNGRTDVSSIEHAHELLAPLVGNQWAPILFAVALIAAGQSSTVTGTLAGQIVMEGYLHIRMNPWLRRLITRVIAVIPAYIVIIMSGDDKMTELLILSQVILSIQLAYAIIPLVFAVSNKQKMGDFVIKKPLLIISIIVITTIVSLNIKLVYNEAQSLWAATESLWARGSIALVVLFLTGLLFVTIIYPLLSTHRTTHRKSIHHDSPLQQLTTPAKYNCVALALDFSRKDESVLSHALLHGQTDTTYLLIHIVESASAKILGEHAADAETEYDRQRLTQYAELLQAQGHKVITELGYRNRSKAIAIICKSHQADLLIMGAHRHTGFWDILYGQTIDSVRHRINIPVLIV